MDVGDCNWGKRWYVFTATFKKRKPHLPFLPFLPFITTASLFPNLFSFTHLPKPAMPLTSPATLTATTSPHLPAPASSSATVTAAAAAAAPPALRTFRCRRCADRKFRTPQHLALHILGKHGHTNNTTTSLNHHHDDTRSVTFTFTSPSHNTHNTHTTKRPPYTSTHSVVPLISKRPRTHTAASSMRHVAAQAKQSTPHHHRHRHRHHRQVDAVHDGESIGPVAHDVYVTKCLDGRIPVIPVHSQPAKTINFAQGLF